MISFQADGRFLAVEVAELNESITELRLSVGIDRREVLDPVKIIPTKNGWQVQLPPELYDCKPHYIALDIASDGYSIERTAFSFAASTEPLKFFVRD